MRGLTSHSPLHQEDVIGLVEGVRTLVILGVAIGCTTFTLVAQTWRGSDHAYRSNQLCRILTCEALLFVTLLRDYDIVT